MRNTIWTVLAITVVLFFMAIVSVFAAKKKSADSSQEMAPAIAQANQGKPEDNSDKSQELVVKLETNTPSVQPDLAYQDDYNGSDDSDQATSDEPMTVGDMLVKERAKVCSLAKDFLGTPYRWGGTTPRAFDCSGFTRYVYAKIGVHLPRTAREQYKVGKKVPNGKWAGGDLVFFDMNKGYVSHVGMYLGASCFIHASNPRTGVKIDNLGERSYRRHYVGARRYSLI